MSSAERTLAVASGKMLVGTVYETDGVFTFRYDTAWVAARESFDLSPRLKRIQQIHSGPEVKNFLENLLPEEGTRNQVAELNKVDVNDIIGLLKASGRDSAGALQAYTQEEFQALNYDPQKEVRLSLEDLAQGVSEHGSGINYITSIGLKPSLAGAQDKIACRFDKSAVGKEVSFPISGGATTHIFKPNNVVKNKIHKALEMSAVNELVSLRIAQKVLKNVPATDFYESSARDHFIIERYDRKRQSQDIGRIHQFDFCQYFGLSSAEKYEVSPRNPKGKYGIKELYHAVQAESEDPRDAERVLDWVVFNYLLHNTDSHLKNISMLATESGFTLAPYYDITSVGLYQYQGAYLFDNQFAFDIGGMSDMDKICDIQWTKLAEHIGLSDNYMLLKIRKMTYEIFSAINEVHSEIHKQLKEPRNQKLLVKVLRYIGLSVETKSNRCLINTSLKAKDTHCIECGKILPKASAINIGPECLRRFQFE